jgi:hypothetical protein
VASEDNRRLQRALAPTLKARGFRKSAATWRKYVADATAVVNLQGSQYSPSFYLNLGVYFRAVGDRTDPLEHHCHIRTRLSDLVPDRQRLAELLDFERPVPGHIRFTELERLLVDHGLPWLELVATREGALAYGRSLPAGAAWVTRDGARFLGLA